MSDYDRPRFAHVPVHGERHPDAELSRHARRLATRVERANSVASALRERRLMASQEPPGPEARAILSGPWNGLYGHRNGGRRTARSTPGPSTNPRQLDVSFVSGVYPQWMSSKADRVWREL